LGCAVLAAQRHDGNARRALHLVVWPGEWHRWHVPAPLLPKGTQALRAQGEAICQQVIG
jgi:hypothetical protein